MYFFIAIATMFSIVVMAFLGAYLVRTPRGHHEVYRVMMESALRERFRCVRGSMFDPAAERYDWGRIYWPYESNMSAWTSLFTQYRKHAIGVA